MSRPTLTQKIFSVAMTALMVLTYNPLVAVAAEWVQPESAGEGSGDQALQLDENTTAAIGEDGEAVLVGEDGESATTGDEGTSIPEGATDASSDGQFEAAGSGSTTESLDPMTTGTRGTLTVTNAGTEDVDWRYDQENDVIVVMTSTPITITRS